jgi:D-tyrosyl-tRNA(Tyr) deacylase
VIALLQRVAEASVTIAGETVGSIGRGLLVFIGVQPMDTEANAQRLIERCLGYRVFPDDTGRMNLALRDIAGGLLLVPQFTLAADTRKGTRASFTSAAEPELGASLFAVCQTLAANQYGVVASGRFGADMQVALINDGPVTFWLEA